MKSPRRRSLQIKKRIIRTVLREIVVRVEDERLHAMIHWHGGDHTALDVATRVRGPLAGCTKKEAETETETAALIITLVRDDA